MKNAIVKYTTEICITFVYNKKRTDFPNSDYNKEKTY